MNRWKLAVPVVACMFAALSSAGCYATAQVEDRTPDAVYVTRERPVERVEVAPAAPRREHVWIKGHWDWNGRDWDWIPGRWETRRGGVEWVPSHYERRGGRWVYIRGHWRRAGR